MKNLLKGVNLYLIGMPGSGKTTLGRLLAQHLGYGFVDSDTVIEKAAGETITELFAKYGEPAFRQIESQIFAEICAHTKLVISTGGGVVLRRENWGYLRHGLIIWLHAPVELLLVRLAEDTTRPLLQAVDLEAKLRSLLAQRQALYSQADLQITISEEDTPEQVTERVLASLPRILKSTAKPL